jgi:hypothetical protein
MHTPEQVKQMLARLGGRVDDEPPPFPDKTIAFQVSGGRGTTIILLFNDEALCKAAMARLQP